MATDDRQISIAGAEAGKAIPSALKVVESDDDLRRKSVPARMFASAHTTDTSRSCSANGTCSRDTPLTLHRETKAAFEDTPLVNKTVENEKK